MQIKASFSHKYALKKFKRHTNKILNNDCPLFPLLYEKSVYSYDVPSISYVEKISYFLCFLKKFQLRLFCR